MSRARTGKVWLWINSFSFMINCKFFSTSLQIFDATVHLFVRSLLYSAAVNWNVWPHQQFYRRSRAHFLLVVRPHHCVLCYVLLHTELLHWNNDGIVVRPGEYVAVGSSKWANCSGSSFLEARHGWMLLAKISHCNHQCWWMSIIHVENRMLMMCH